MAERIMNTHKGKTYITEIIIQIEIKSIYVIVQHPNDKIAIIEF